MRNAKSTGNTVYSHEQARKPMAKIAWKGNQKANTFLLVN
jgi:hypothetical protein